MRRRNALVALGTTVVTAGCLRISSDNESIETSTSETAKDIQPTQSEESTQSTESETVSPPTSVTLSEQWTKAISDSPHGVWTGESSVVVHSSSFGNTADVIQRFSLDTGAKEWSWSSSDPLRAAGHPYVTDSGDVYAAFYLFHDDDRMETRVVRLSTNGKMQNQRTFAGQTSFIIANDDVLLVPRHDLPDSDEAVLTCLNIPDLSTRWNIQSGGMEGGIIFDGVCHASFGQSLRGYRLSDGLELYRTAANTTTPAVVETDLAVGGDTLRRISTDATETRWSVSVGSDVRGRPTVEADHIFARTEKGILCATKDGTVKWHTQFESDWHYRGHPPVVKNGLVFTRVNQENIAALTLERGNNIYSTDEYEYPNLVSSPSGLVVSSVEHDSYVRLLTVSAN
jgi:hypothetical protein